MAIPRQPTHTPRIVWSKDLPLSTEGPQLIEVRPNSGQANNTRHASGVKSVWDQRASQLQLI